MDPALNRDYNADIDFEKVTTGSLDVSVQFTGALGVISASGVEVLLSDIGEAETPSTVPTIISTVVENTNRGTLKFFTSRNIQTTRTTME